MIRKLRILPLLGLAACGPSDVQLADLGITVTTPSGWAVEMSRGNSIGAGSAELKKGKKTFGFIGDNVLMPLGAHDDAWPKESPHTLAQLQTALAPFEPTDPEEFPNGFGVQYTKNGKPKFLYVVAVGDKEYDCVANDWIDKADVEAAISICKSIR